MSKVVVLVLFIVIVIDEAFLPNLLNIEPVVETFVISQFEILRDDNFLQLSNIIYIVATDEVLKLLKSNDVISLLLLNISLILVTLLVFQVLTFIVVAE